MAGGQLPSLTIASNCRLQNDLWPGTEPINEQIVGNNFNRDSGPGDGV